MLSELITKETKSVMKKALLRFSKERGISPKDNQLLICGGPEGVPHYKYMRGYTPENELTFNEILGVTFDFKSREALATPFMQNAIMRLSNEKNISPEDIQIMIFTSSEKCKDVNLFAYTNGKKIQPVTFEWLFSEGVELKDLM